MSLEQANKAEREYLVFIKSLPCGVCGSAAPSDAHHILDTGRRISHFMTIPLCRGCHQDAMNGIHGQGRLWKVYKITEQTVLADVIQALFTAGEELSKGK